MKDKDRVIAKLEQEGEWKQIGVVGVDSGTLLVGDPCYFLGDKWADKQYDEELVDGMKGLSKQLKFDMGHDGKGVVFTAGFGDGVYEVWALIKDYGDDKGSDKRVKEVKIVLIEE